LAESKELKKDSCCCGATKSNPCACMYQGVMSCSAKAPMCACYKALAEKKGAVSFGAESWSGDCRRCGIKSNAHTMSWFNTDLICMDCSDKEKEHPKYQEAKSMENAEVKKGNFNFQGIGLESESFDAEEVCPRCKTAVTPMLRPNGEVLMAVCDCGMIAKTPAQWRA